MSYRHDVPEIRKQMLPQRAAAASDTPVRVAR